MEIVYLSSPITNAQPTKVVVDKCNHKSVSLITGKINDFKKIKNYDFRIFTGGTEANPHEFPHHAVLGRGEENAIDWVCGGSLISPRFILTGVLIQ